MTPRPSKDFREMLERFSPAYGYRMTKNNHIAVVCGICHQRVAVASYTKSDTRSDKNCEAVLRRHMRDDHPSAA